MNIQSNINQTLSVAGILLSQTPWAEEQRAKYMEKQKVKQAYKDLDKLHKLAESGKEIEGAVEERAEKAEKFGTITKTQKKIWAEGEAVAQGAIAQGSLEAAKKVFELDPTPENYEIFAREATGPAEVEHQRETYISSLDKEENERKAAEAEAEKERKAEEKKVQKAAERREREEEKMAYRAEERKRKEDEKIARQEKAEEKARKAQEREQQRLTRSKILEGVYHPLTDIPARKAGHEERLKEGKY